MAQTLAQTKQISQSHTFDVSQSHHTTPDDTNSHSVIYSTQNLDLWVSAKIMHYKILI